jgi:hypothetical protein
MPKSKQRSHWRTKSALLTAGISVAVIAVGALYAAGVIFQAHEVKTLNLGQAVSTGAFSFTPLRVECGKPLTAIPAHERHEYDINKLPGEICFVPVRLIGPKLHIPPLILGTLYVGNFVYPSVTNAVKISEGIEGPVDDNAIVKMVFAIPKFNVPTRLKLEAIDQVKAEPPLFFVYYRLPPTA